MTPSSRPADIDFKTPSLKEWQEANKQLERQNSARMEARAKAQAKADQDLGLSPPDYIENLKDKLRRKPSVDEETNDVLPTRTRSFSEPNSDAEKSWNIPIRPSVEIAEVPPAKPPRLHAITPAPKVELTRMSDTPGFNASKLKSSKSMSQMVVSPTAPILQPPSPRSDVIGTMFVQQINGPSSTSPTSPPQSPRSITSSKSTSYLWAGLSPAESQAKLDGDSASASATSPSTSNEVWTNISSVLFLYFINVCIFLQQGVKVKKSKDRERRRSIIQTITGLFTSSKKEEPKDPEAAASKKSSPSKFQLPKFSPKKEKSSKVFAYCWDFFLCHFP